MKQLTDRVFDVLVIGGGLAGVSVARDCAMRRLSVLLVEKGEIGGGWTDILTGLLTPDLALISTDRDYLQELSTEVGVYLGIAPNLMEQLPILHPIVEKRSLAALNRLRSIYSAYDTFRVWKGTHTHTELKTRHVPLLDAALNRDLQRIFAWDEWLVHPGRLCARTLKSAEACGAIVAVGCSAERIQTHNQRVAGAWIRTAEGLKLVRARSIINAAGAEVRKFYPPSSVLHRGKFQAGLTAVWERRLGTYAIAPDPIEEPTEAFLPSGFHHRFGVQKFDLAEPAITHAHIEIIYNRILDKMMPIYPSIGKHRLLEFRTAIAWQPIGPLARFFFDHASEQHQGLLSVLPHREVETRLVAEKIVDRISGFLRHRDSCRTHLELLPGCTTDPLSEGTAASSERWDKLAFDRLAISRLVHRHGHHAFAILELARSQPELAAVVCECEQITAAELAYCRENEWAQGTRALSLRTDVTRGNCRGARCASWLGLWDGKTPNTDRRAPLSTGELVGKEYASMMRGFGEELDPT